MLRALELKGSYTGANVVVVGSLELGAGELVAITGPNGSGKSAFIQALANLIFRTEGRVFFQGEDVSSFSSSRLVRECGWGIVSQHVVVFGDFSPRQNFEFYSRRRELVNTPGDEVASAILARQLSRDVPSRLLSGGEQKLLALGGVLSSCSKLLLLDEPTAGLAPGLGEWLGKALVRHKRGGGSAVVVTHDRRLESLADKLYTTSIGSSDPSTLVKKERGC